MNYFLRTTPHSKPLPFWKALLTPLTLFSNNEDWFFGDSNWNPEGKRDLKTAFKWWIRNPFHDLFFHIIGFTDKRTQMWGPYVPSITNTSDNGWNFHFVMPYDGSWQRGVLGILYIVLGLLTGWTALFVLAGLMLAASFPSIPFPFVSYVSETGKVRSAYIGWRPSGACGFKFQLRRKT